MVPQAFPGPKASGCVCRQGRIQPFSTLRQNPYAERVIGSIRRERLDHVIVLNEDHLHRILSKYFTYYHESRTHLSLDRNSPVPRSVQPGGQGHVGSNPTPANRLNTDHFLHGWSSREGPQALGDCQGLPLAKAFMVMNVTPSPRIMPRKSSRAFTAAGPVLW